MLTAIAITMIILGYNYMANEGDFFKSTSYYYVEYEQAPGLGKGNKVLLNGFKVGFIHLLSYDSDKQKIIATIKLTEKIKIPVNSIAQIISEDILGTRAVKLIFDEENAKNQLFLSSGDKLTPSIEISKLDELSRTVDPMVHKVEEILEYLDSVIIKSGQLQSALSKTTDVMTAIEGAANAGTGLMNRNNQNLYESIKSLKELLAELNEQKGTITATINNLGEFSADLNKSDLIANMDKTIANMESITQKLDKGTGTLGKLINEDDLHKELLKTLADAQALLKDLNNYPQKYVPMPWGKRQRRKAMEQSSNEPYNK
jgi:phospholipid/cholesterol/gamma-HCH transport system substrate-binding protein